MVTGAGDEDISSHATAGLPFVTVKFAQSLDGRIATSTGDSQWISGPQSQRLAHKLRSEHDAIMVGIGTVLADDPRLTVRLVRGRDPLRVVVDSALRIPLTARMLADGSAGGTLIAHSTAADRTRIREVLKLGANTLQVRRSKNRRGLDLESLLIELGRRGIRSVLVEGGRGIITSLLAARAVNRLVVVIAPRIIGQGIESIGDLGVKDLKDAMTFSAVRVRRLGPDIVFDGRLK